jgi:hypothetical protein
MLGEMLIRVMGHALAKTIFKESPEDASRPRVTVGQTKSYRLDSTKLDELREYLAQRGFIENDPEHVTFLMWMTKCNNAGQILYVVKVLKNLDLVASGSGMLNLQELLPEIVRSGFNDSHVPWNLD